MIVTFQGQPVQVEFDHHDIKGTIIVGATFLESKLPVDKEDYDDLRIAVGNQYEKEYFGY